MERFNRSIETLRLIGGPAFDNATTKQKKDTNLTAEEKKRHILVLEESILSPQIRNQSDFAKANSQAFEVLFCQCNDQVYMVREVAGDALNRIIKQNEVDGSITRTLVEIFRELRRLGPSRSFQAALVRFANLVHYVKPNKRRAFALSLLPCMEGITKYPKEDIYECLEKYCDTIWSRLMSYFSDEETKKLCNYFVSNLQLNSLKCRRAASKIIACSVTFCRKPELLTYYLLKIVTENLVPPQIDKHHIQGNLMAVKEICERNLFVEDEVLDGRKPQLSKIHSSVSSSKFQTVGSGVTLNIRKPTHITIDKLLLLYEEIIFYVCSSVAEITIEALQALDQLLKHIPELLKNKLIQNGAITNSVILRPDGFAPALFQFGSHSRRSSFSNISGSVSSLAGSQCDLTFVPNANTHLEFDDVDTTCLFPDASMGHNSTVNFRPSSVPTEPLSAESLPDSRDSIQILPADSKRETGIYAPFSEIEEQSVVEEDSQNDSLSALDHLSLPAPPISLKNLHLNFKDDNLDSSSVHSGEQIFSEPTTPAGLSMTNIPENIGKFADSDGIPAVYLCRLLASKFLLAGKKTEIIPDREVRVAFKNLALSCISNIVKLYPDVIKETVTLNTIGDDVQYLSDLLIFITHDDHKLKAGCLNLVSSFLLSAEKQSGGDIPTWLHGFNLGSLTDVLEPEHFANLLDVLLTDVSSVSRNAIVSLKELWVILTKYCSIEVLNGIVEHVFANCGTTYKLEGVAICDFFVTLLESDYGLRDDSLIQSEDLRVKVLHMLIDVFLKNNEEIIQNAASEALWKIVLCGSGGMVTSPDAWINSALAPVQGLVPPYTDMCDSIPRLDVQTNLPLTLNMLFQSLVAADLHGHKQAIVAALGTMLRHFSIAVYTKIWLSVNGSNDLYSLGFLKHILQLLHISGIMLDYTGHQTCLDVIGQLYAGHVIMYLKEGKFHGSNNNSSLAGHSSLNLIYNNAFLHCLRVLNLYYYVITEQNPISTVTATTALRNQISNLPQAGMSPVKRRIKGTVDDKTEPSTTQSSIKVKMGDCAETTNYFALYDLLRRGHDSFKRNLTPVNEDDRFISLLKVVLKCVSCLIESADFNDIGKYVEELLIYLKETITIATSESVQCAVQVLRALCGTNINLMCEVMSTPASNSSAGSAFRYRMQKGVGFSSPVNIGVLNSPKRKSSIRRSFPSQGDENIYELWVAKPYAQLTQRLAGSLASHDLIGQEVNAHLGWLRLKTDRHVLSLFKQGSAKAELMSYIRFFEPALRMYTGSLNAELHTQVLQMLIQLVHVRVNYSMLDADLKFLKFIFSQFGTDEDDHCADCCENLNFMTTAFQFFIVLSYEHYNNERIVTLPKMIQMCDNLMATGLDPVKSIIPALHIMMLDLWFLRSQARIDNPRDIETQKEVVISLLNRVVHSAKALELFALILYQCKIENEEKWKKLSRDIVDLLFPKMAKLQVDLATNISLNSVCRVLDLVCPSAYRPIDFVLTFMFEPPNSSIQKFKAFVRWFAFQHISIRVILLHAKEDPLLQRLEQLACKITFDVNFLKRIRSTSAVLNDNNQGRITSPTVEDISCDSGNDRLAKYILNVVILAANEVCYRQYELISLDDDLVVFFHQTFSGYLELLCYICQSGKFNKIRSAMQNVLIKNDSPIWSVMKGFMVNENAVVISWLTLTTFMHVSEWWKWVDDKILRAKLLNNGHEPMSNFTRLVLVLYLDFLRVCVNVPDGLEALSNYALNIVQICAETPCSEFLRFIFSYDKAPQSFMTGLQSKLSRIDLNSISPELHMKILLCCEVMPQRLDCLVDMLNLFCDIYATSKCVAVSKSAEILLCRKMELQMVEIGATSPGRINQLQNNTLLTESIQRTFDVGLHKFGKLKRVLEKFCNVISGSANALQPPLSSFDQASMAMDIRLTELEPHNLSPTSFISPSMQLISSDDIARLLAKEMQGKFNKMKFVNLLKMAQRFQLTTSSAIARMLQTFAYEEASELLCNELAQPELVEACLLLGWKAFESDLHRNSVPSLSSVMNTATTPNSPISPTHRISGQQGGQPDQNRLSTTQYPLLAAAKQALLGTLKKLTMQFFVVDSDAITWRENQMIQVYETLTKLQLGVTFLVKKVEFLRPFSESDCQAVCRFAVMLIKATNLLLKRGKIGIGTLSHGLQCVTTILTSPSIYPWLHTTPGQVDLQFVLCDALYNVFEAILGESFLEQFKETYVRVTIPQRYDELWRNYAKLFCFWESNEAYRSVLCQNLQTSVQNCLMATARMPILMSFIRTPTMAFKLVPDWNPIVKSDGVFVTMPVIPVYCLQEREVLTQFIRRALAIGWCSRSQFEESWMNLLGVLSSTPIGIELGKGHKDTIEMNIGNSALAVRSITSLLLQSLLLPQPGNPIASRYLLRHRESNLPFLNSKNGQKLLFIKGALRRMVHECCEESSCAIPLFCGNIERSFDCDSFSSGQISLELLWSSTGIISEEKQMLSSITPTVADKTNYSTDNSDPTDDVRHDIEQTVRRSSSNYIVVSESGLDLISCLRSLIDLYKHWLTTGISSVPLPLLSATVESMVLLSDIFTDKSHYVILRQQFRIIQHQALLAEDDVLLHYLAIGLLKAAAVLGMEDADSQREVLHLIDSCLVNSQLSVRTSCLNGSLYLLQSLTQDETLAITGRLGLYVNEQIRTCLGDITVRVREAIGRESPTRATDLQHYLCCWAVGFYLVSHFTDEKSNSAFNKTFLNHCVQAIQILPKKNDFKSGTMLPIWQTVMEGIQSLIITAVIPSDQLRKLTLIMVESLKSTNDPLITAGCLEVLMCCFYSAPYELSPTNTSEGGDVSAMQDRHTSAMERMGLFLNKLTCSTNQESRMVEEVLPRFLSDHFTPTDLINKIISELLNSELNSIAPRCLSRLLLQVLERLRDLETLHVLCDWTVLTVPSFAYKSPIWFAVWSLTCFLLSATQNHWCRAVFAFMEARYGKNEAVDQTIFRFAVQNYKAQLEDPSQVESFVNTFEQVAKKFPNSPFVEALKEF